MRATERSRRGRPALLTLLTLVNRGGSGLHRPKPPRQGLRPGPGRTSGANVSRYSASQLVEALVRTTDIRVVSAAREFVGQHYLHELTPVVLARLSKLYRPPRLPGGGTGKRRRATTAQRPSLPRVLLAGLENEEWSERDQISHDAGLEVAKKRRARPRAFEIESFRMTGRCHFRRSDVVIQVVHEDNGRILVTPPGNVLHVAYRQDRNRHVSFIYLERPLRRRRSLKAPGGTVGLWVT